MTRMWLETNHSVVDRIIFCVLENEDFKLYNSLMAQRYFPNNIHFVLHNSPIVRKPKRSPKFDSEDDVQRLGGKRRKEKCFLFVNLLTNP